MLRLHFDETMRGHWSPRGAPFDMRRIEFSLHVVSSSLIEMLFQPAAIVAGTIDAEGLTTRAELSGTLGLDVFRTGTLPYDFSFLGNDGKRYRFVGQKTVFFTRLLDTMTTLPADILGPDGSTFGTSEVRFDLRDLGAFLRSFSVRHSRR